MLKGTTTYRHHQLFRVLHALHRHDTHREPLAHVLRAGVFHCLQDQLKQFPQFRHLVANHHDFARHPLLVPNIDLLSTLRYSDYTSRNVAPLVRSHHQFKARITRIGGHHPHRETLSPVHRQLGFPIHLEALHRDVLQHHPQRGCHPALGVGHHLYLRRLRLKIFFDDNPRVRYLHVVVSSWIAISFNLISIRIQHLQPIWDIGKIEGCIGRRLGRHIDPHRLRDDSAANRIWSLSIVYKFQIFQILSIKGNPLHRVRLHGVLEGERQLLACRAALLIRFGFQRERRGGVGILPGLCARHLVQARLPPRAFQRHDFQGACIPHC